LFIFNARRQEANRRQGDIHKGREKRENEDRRNRRATEKRQKEEQSEAQRKGMGRRDEEVYVKLE
jgi:hypothetical protein